MKKLYISFLLCLSVVSSSLACGGWDDSDYNYYNLFMQTIIDNPYYYPFLLVSEYPYYSSKEKEKNENIEQWQSYLGLSYEDAEYLVFKASKATIDSLIKKQTVTDERLNFATASWTKRYHQALLYLSYAKYLEPYMIVTIGDRDGWSYYYRDDYGYYSNDAGDLDYEKVINVLRRSWNAEKDNELKLRYGYQMVRLAHYTRRYAESVDFFNRYVESLNYRPAMYYYALNQCAGAERGLGNTDEANYLFFKVFSNTKNLKTNTLNSICLSSDVDYQQFLERAKSANEINDAYMLLGYMSFSNPLAMAEEIIKKSPDAIQAKVLIARAINQLERNHNGVGDDNAMLLSKNGDNISLAKKDEFFLQMLDFSVEMTKNKQVKEMDFWNLTTAYLYFLNKDFDISKKYLAQVSEKDDKYKSQKELFATYIYLCEQPTITLEVEKVLFEKYRAHIYKEDFLKDILANRYFLQEDYAKSFLLHHSISAMEGYINADLLNQIETFLSKPNKNEWEKHIARNDDTIEYINYLRGNYYLALGELPKSLDAFSKVQPTFQWRDRSYYNKAKDDYSGFTGISDKIFGYNQIVRYSYSPENIMRNDFSAQFSFIKKTMNKKELVEALIQLQKIGEQDNETGAKANYLLGNFFYNVSSTGYYWHILRFDLTNGTNWPKMGVTEEQDIYKGVYFKKYPMYYDNQVDIANDYLQKAYEQASDNELNARIAFALSKCEQANWDNEPSDSYWGYYRGKEILISNREYFAELAKYKDTHFYDEVKTHCKYFEYYVNHSNE